MSEPWRHKAACSGKDTAYWFPEQTGPYNPATARAVAICRSCPVQLACLAHAQEQPEHHGIWGGLTPAQRLGMRRNPVIEHGTNHGYNRHLHYGQPACELCKRAHAEYQDAKRRIRERARTRDRIEEIS